MQESARDKIRSRINRWISLAVRHPEKYPTSSLTVDVLCTSPPELSPGPLTPSNQSRPHPIKEEESTAVPIPQSSDDDDAPSPPRIPTECSLQNALEKSNDQKNTNNIELPLPPINDNYRLHDPVDSIAQDPGTAILSQSNSREFSWNGPFFDSDEEQDDYICISDRSSPIFEGHHARPSDNNKIDLLDASDGNHESSPKSDNELTRKVDEILPNYTEKDTRNNADPDDISPIEVNRSKSASFETTAQPKQPTINEQSLLTTSEEVCANNDTSMESCKADIFLPPGFETCHFDAELTESEHGKERSLKSDPLENSVVLQKPCHMEPPQSDNLNTDLSGKICHNDSIEEILAENLSSLSRTPEKTLLSPTNLSTLQEEISEANSSEKEDPKNVGPSTQHISKIDDCKPANLSAPKKGISETDPTVKADRAEIADLKDVISNTHPALDIGDGKPTGLSTTQERVPTADANPSQRVNLEDVVSSTHEISEMDDDKSVDKVDINDISEEAGNGIVKEEKASEENTDKSLQFIDSLDQRQPTPSDTSQDSDLKSAQASTEGATLELTPAAEPAPRIDHDEPKSEKSKSLSLVTHEPIELAPCGTNSDNSHEDHKLELIRLLDEIASLNPIEINIHERGMLSALGRTHDSHLNKNWSENSSWKPVIHAITLDMARFLDWVWHQCEVESVPLADLAAYKRDPSIRLKYISEFISQAILFVRKDYVLELIDQSGQTPKRDPLEEQGVQTTEFENDLAEVLKPVREKFSFLGRVMRFFGMCIIAVFKILMISVALTCGVVFLAWKRGILMDIKTCVLKDSQSTALDQHARELLSNRPGIETIHNFDSVRSGRENPPSHDSAPPSIVTERVEVAPIEEYVFNIPELEEIDFGEFIDRESFKVHELEPEDPMILKLREKYNIADPPVVPSIIQER